MLLTAPPGAPLRDPDTGAIIGATPFMDSLIFLIALVFLICGICYGIGAKTISNADDVVNSISTTFASLGGLILMFLMIAEFIAFFNYTNLPRVIAVEMAQVLERVDVPALLLLILMILVIAVLDFILPGGGAEVGDLRAGVHPDLRPPRRGAADRARRVPGRRLADERADAADGVLPVHRHDRPAVRHEGRHRDADRV